MASGLLRGPQLLRAEVTPADSKSARPGENEAQESGSLGSLSKFGC